MRNIILGLTAAAVLTLVNCSIWKKEKLIAHGRTVLLELAPVDPRSLMQGDYMALRFKIENDAFPRDKVQGIRDGWMVVAVDSRSIGSFRRFADTTQNTDELLLRYRIRNDRPKFASNAFFFQERQADLYSGAKYGEFRVAANGEALLVALRGADLQTLGSGVNRGQ
jgi:uncharacterized membrane-anchored protein